MFLERFPCLFPHFGLYCHTQILYKTEMSYHVVVIGGGISGISAAWTLRKSGVEVTLIEARPQLGGRLASYRSPALPTPLDNGPHLFLSTYLRTRALLEEMGVGDDFFYPYPGSIPFALSGGSRGSLNEWFLPAPLNFAGGLLGFQLLSMKARWRTLKTVQGLLYEETDPTQSIAAWLESHSYPEERAFFWKPLAKAALNSPLEVQPVRYLQAVLREGFCRGFFGGRLGFARKPLSTILGNGMCKALETAGVRIQTSIRSSAGVFNRNRIAALRFNEGKSVSCDAVILALPPWALADWLMKTDHSELYKLATLAQCWSSQPITSIYLWAEHRPWLEPFTCLPDQPVAWVFDYSRLWGKARAPLGLMLDVNSGMGLWKRGNRSLRQIITAIDTSIPQLLGVQWSAIRWVTERRATPLKPQHLWSERLSQETSIPNLLLAGDWLDSDLPPTVEAAVRSGERAASLLLDKG
ncbi:MAG: hydroxysqualene dehydroxylase HpnE [bacterium]